MTYIARQRKHDKQIQTLETHLFEVSELSKTFASKIKLASCGELIGLLHDLGKYSQQFQRYIGSASGNIDPDADEYLDAKAMKGKVDHSSAGAQLIWQTLSSKGEVEKLIAQVLALCIASHHSGLIDNISCNKKSLGKDVFSKRMAKCDDKTHLQEVIKKMDTKVKAQYQALIADSALISSFKKAIQKIAEKYNSRELFQMQAGLLTRFLFSCLIDADRLNSADFEYPEDAKKRQNNNYTDFSQLLTRLEKRLSGFTTPSDVNTIRQQISNECLQAAERKQGIFTLSVPTGGGKTLASLRFALRHAEKYQLDRIIYIVPFTSIIDQNAQDARKTLLDTDGNIVLEHHSNLIQEKENEQHYLNKILSENWDAPIIYTTSVQFLETFFGSGTSTTRRLHQLAKSVIIFDEIQTLPINCTHLFCHAVNFLTEQCDSTVVLCTATQPLLNKVAPSKGRLSFTHENEIVSNTQKLFTDLKRVEVLDRIKAGGWSFKEIAELAIKQIEESGSCLVIVNTKKSAKKIYDDCKDNDKYELTHLSTDMCPAHRKTVLKQMTDKLKDENYSIPQLCISTQLIEAGVDVDFDSVIRFLAGLDSIAQAAGRCNRNGKHALGKVYIVNPKPENENLDKLPSLAIGKDITQRIFNDYSSAPELFDHDVIGSTAMQQYFKHYFFNRKSEMDYQLSIKELGHNDNLINLLACNNKATKDSQLFLQQAFMSAAKLFKSINAPTQGVVVPYKRGKNLIEDLCGVSDLEEKRELLKEAQQYTVNIYPHVLKALIKEDAVYLAQPELEVFCLNTRYYDENFGLSEEPVGKMNSLIG